MAESSLRYVPENIFKLRDSDRIIGHYLYDEFDEVLARVEALLTEPETFIPRYLVITLGGALNISGKRMILPVEVCRTVDLGKVRTQWRKESLMTAPTPRDVRRVTPAEEEWILDYFDLEPYWVVKKSAAAKDKPTDPPPGDSH